MTGAADCKTAPADGGALDAADSRTQGVADGYSAGAVDRDRQKTATN
jgi:hypothetical protein